MFILLSYVENSFNVFSVATPVTNNVQRLSYVENYVLHLQYNGTMDIIPIKTVYFACTISSVNEIAILNKVSLVHNHLT